MNNASVLYYNSEFGLTTEDASKIAFIYGSMNIFARALGGICSDRLNIKMGMRGRLWLQTALLICEGVLIVVFAHAKSLPGAIITMCIFSIFTQAAEGAIYGVVPYVHKLHTGAVAGFVGSGGNVGSVVYGLGFRNLEYRTAFIMMGSIVIVSSFLSFFINIPLHAGMISGEDNHSVLQARERYKKQRERAHQAIERERLEHSGGRNRRVIEAEAKAGGSSTVEGNATVESDDKQYRYDVEDVGGATGSMKGSELPTVNETKGLQTGL